MRLYKVSRRRIYKAHAKREPVEITWPKEAPLPRNGHKYPVKGFPPETRLEVVSHREVGGRWKAVVKLNHDPVRPLHGLKGVRREDGDYEDEPEQVSKQYQERLTKEGQVKSRMLSAEQRQRVRVLGDEQSIASAQRKGRTSTVEYQQRKLEQDRRKVSNG